MTIKATAKRKIMLAILLFTAKTGLAQQTDLPRNLIIPQSCITSNSVTLLWDKPLRYGHIYQYLIFRQGNYIGKSAKTNFTINGLDPGKSYVFKLKAEHDDGLLSASGVTVKCHTKPAGKIFNVQDFGAKGDGKNKNTAALQRTIDACTPGGTVYIPPGIFLSGALYLKSDMELYIAEGATLQGSSDVRDYYPFILNR